MYIKSSVQSNNKENCYIFCKFHYTQSARLEALPHAADIVALTLVDLTSPDDATREKKCLSL